MKKANIYLAYIFLIVIVVVLAGQVSGIYIQAGADVSALQARENTDISATLREGLSINGTGRLKGIMKSELNITSRTDYENKSNKNINSSLMAKLSNGRIVEIKIMPDQASDIAIFRLKIHICSEENNCTIVLKETGNSNKTRAEYEVSAYKKVKIFGIFKKEMAVRSNIDAETGDITYVHEPWWAVLTTEIEAENN